MQPEELPRGLFSLKTSYRSSFSLNVFQWGVNGNGFTISGLPNTSADPQQCKGEGGREELLRSFDEGILDEVVRVRLLQATLSTSRRWCTREGGSSELLRSLGGGLDEVVAGLLAMIGRAVVPHREAEVGFDSIALLFGPSRNLR